MNLKLKIWLILSLVMLILGSLAAVLNYQEVEEFTQMKMRQQAIDLRASLMATRRVYHQQFLASSLPLNDHTLGFLPAHAMSRIAQDYPNWSKSGVRFNNVSDRPRNPANQADADELAVMAWFRAHPKAEEYTGTIRDGQGRDFFYFATPIWTEPDCLKCHATPATAPATAPATNQQRYRDGYGYQVGDLRGVMSIRIPTDTSRLYALGHWQSEVLGLLLLLLGVLLTLGWLLNHYVIRRVMKLHAASRQMARGDYGQRLDDTSQDEIGELASCFNEMSGAIEQREKALRESQEKYRILADYSSEWEYWAAPDGRYRYVSPGCKAICGHNPEEFLADPGLLDRLLHPDDLPLWRAHVEAALPSPERYPHAQLPLRIRGISGEYRWIEHNCVPVFDAAGQYLGRRGVNRDITERRRAEELERYSAFQAGIAEMSTSVLHNIGNAITAITQDAEIINQTGGELERVAALLDDNAGRTETLLAEPDAASASLLLRQCAIQHEAARTIRGLTGDSLRQRSRSLGIGVQHIADIVRIQQGAAKSNGQKSSFSLTQAIRTALLMQGNAAEIRGIQVTVAVDPAVETVTLSHNRLLQALVNVIRNSIEAIDQRGGEAPGQIDIHGDALAAQLRITVTDNGAGFDPATCNDLFRFGYSTKQRGSGFGLHSVAMFAQECGGQVALESEGPDRGARLVMILPRLSNHTAAPKSESS